jgi:intraflagellar transport protein 74
LLEHMQKTMQRQNKLPTQQEVGEMRSDLKFKQGQLEDSETTAARLRVSKEQAQNDLEKVKTLDKRISNEKQQANLKIQQMQDEMSNKFTKTDDLKVQFEQEKKRLTLI